MYIVVVLAQTLVLPLVSGIIHLAVGGGNPLIVFGMWWAFWGVGTRLLVAGISQLANPSRTAKGILGIEDKGADLAVHELAFANLSFGVIGCLTSLIPGWGIVGALPGALYLGFAGFRHIAERGKNTEENVATWTDLLVFVVVVVGSIAALVTRV
jgi:hypothetical protein